MIERFRNQRQGYTRTQSSRHWVLVCTLGLLGLLLIMVDANAYVTKETKTTLVDFDGGSFHLTGLLDIPPDIESVQLMPVGLTGDMVLSNYPLPVRLANLGAIGHNNFIYVIGGTDDSQVVRDEVYLSSTSLEGEITPWQTQTDLPTARAGAALAIYPLNANQSVLYVLGGVRSNYQPSNTVYRAVIDSSTGQVGTWTADDETLPFPINYASAVQHEGALYVVGGVSTFAFQNVDYATIKADGSLNPFTSTAWLPQPLYNSVAVVYDGPMTDTLYVIGGRNEYTSTFNVYFADFVPGGGLTEWELSAGSLPVHLYAHAGVYLNGEILLSGGVVNAVNPIEGISNTVKAALVDPDNREFGLYDWCLGVKPPTCTIGAWQTGGLLPEPRSLHGMAAGHSKNIYVLGGQDGTLKARNTVYYGSIDDEGARYAPEGEYMSYAIDLGQRAVFRKFAWVTTLSQPQEMGITMQYRYRLPSGTWSQWSSPYSSAPGENEVDIEPPLDDVRYLQYKAVLTTALSTVSPLLDQVELYYELDDPEVAVRKDTGLVYSVPLQTDLEYTIYYTNNGEWVAESVVLTETLPDNTTYAGGSDWQRVGATNVYTYQVGDVAPGASGDTVFQVRTKPSVPLGTRHITDHVEINYPPTIDALGQTIVDPNMENNAYDWSNPLSLFGMAVTKAAIPPDGSTVAPGSLITYTLVYSNIGMRAATEAVLTDIFDDSGGYTVLDTMTVPPPDHGNNVWDLGRVPAGDSQQIQIVVRVNSPLPNNWMLSNQATLECAEDGPYDTDLVSHWVMNVDDEGNPLPMVDLVLENLAWEPVYVQDGDAVRFAVDVTNIGNAPAPAPFLVELYIKPHPSTPPTGPADHDRAFCLDGCTTIRQNFTQWIQSLEPGATQHVVFQNLEADPDFPSTGVYDIYVQVDTSFSGPEYNPYWGRYPEDLETNNMVTGILTIHGGPPVVYLPMIYRNR